MHSPPFLDRAQQTAHLAARLRGIVLLHIPHRLPEQSAQIDRQRLRNTEQRIDGGKPFPFLHPHDHGMAETRASGDFVEGKLLPEPLSLKQCDQPGNNCLTIRGFGHIPVLGDEQLDRGYDYRHNRRQFLEASRP
jgi:hypothetical protein